MKHIIIDENTTELLEYCEKDYRKHHPEFDKIPLSKNKIVYEICQHYLKSP